MLEVADSAHILMNYSSYNLRLSKQIWYTFDQNAARAVLLKHLRQSYITLSIYRFYKKIQKSKKIQESYQEKLITFFEKIDPFAIKIYINIINMKEDKLLEFSFEPLKPQWQQQAFNVITAANTEAFPLLKSGFMKPQVFIAQTRKLYIQTLAAQQQANKHLKQQTYFNHVLLFNGQIVAVMFSMDYVIYYNNITHLFEENQYYALYKDITIQDMSIGERVYFTRMSVKPQWMNKGLGKKMLNEVIQYLKSKCYEGSYSAVVSSVPQNMFRSIGGKLVKGKEFKTELINFQTKIFYNNFTDNVHNGESITK